MKNSISVAFRDTKEKLDIVRRVIIDKPIRVTPEEPSA